MRNKTRTIIVDGSEYIWAVTETLWPDHILRIWTKDQGKIPWCEATFQAPNVVTPHIVVRLIRRILRANGLDLEDMTYRCQLSDVDVLENQNNSEQIAPADAHTSRG